MADKEDKYNDNINKNTDTAPELGEAAAGQKNGAAAPVQKATAAEREAVDGPQNGAAAVGQSSEAIKARGAKKPRLWLLRSIAIVIIAAAILGVWFLKNGVPGSNTRSLDELTGMPLVIEQEFDLEELKGYGLPILIDFGSDTCGPCLVMAPVLEKLHEELAGRAIILYVDIYQFPELTAQFPVEVMPTQVLIDSEGNPFVPESGSDLAKSLRRHTNWQTGEHEFTTHQGLMLEEDILAALYEMGMRDA